MTDVNALTVPPGARRKRVQPVDTIPIGRVSAKDVVLEHYDREQVPLRRYLLFLGVNDATAQEIVQETFLRLFRHLGKNGDRSNLRAWLYRVAHNLARNEQNASHQRRCDSLEATLAGSLPGASAESPEVSLLNREKEDRLREAIEALSAPQRDCLILRAQGMKYREIASVLDLTTSSVAENVQRGLSKLKELL